MNGEFIAPNISEARVESIIERLYDENPTKAAEVEDQFDDAIDIFEDLRFDLEAIELGEGVAAFEEFINFTLNPPDVSTEGTVPVSGIAQLPNAVLPVDPNKNTAINNQIVSASVPNRTTPGLFEKYFSRGIFS